MLPHVVNRSSAGPFRNFFRFEFCDCERLIKPGYGNFSSRYGNFSSRSKEVWRGPCVGTAVPTSSICRGFPCWLPDMTEPRLVVNSGDIRSRYSTSRSNGPYPCQQPSGYSMDDSDLQNLSETWHSRARECRTAAERFRSSDARQRMLTAARDFDRMAQARDDALVKIDPTQGSGSV
jgi:hypothetical protein